MEKKRVSKRKDSFFSVGKQVVFPLKKALAHRHCAGFAKGHIAHAFRALAIGMRQRLGLAQAGFIGRIVWMFENSPVDLIS